MKKILSILLAILLAFSLVACGDSGETAEKYCWNCGEGISTTAFFCGNCGAAAAGTSSENETSSVENTSSETSSNTSSIGSQENTSSKNNVTSNTSSKNNVTSNTSSTSQNPLNSYSYTGTNKLKGTFELQINIAGYGSRHWEKIIDDFQAANPDLDIIAYMDANTNKKMQPRWQKNNPPDFVECVGSNLPMSTYIESGLIYDLTEFYNKATVYGTNTKINSILGSNKIIKHNDGKLYKLPLILGSYGMWYDETWATELGVTLPTNFDELYQLGLDLKAKNIPLFIYGGQSPMYLMHALMFPAISVYGQEMLDRILSGSDLDAYKSAELKDCFTRLKKLIDAGFFHNASVGLSAFDAQSQWLNHKAFFIPNGLWLENEMEGKIPEAFKMRYAVPALNKSNQKQVICTSASQFAVAENAKNKAAALDFIRFIYKTENLKTVVEETKSPVALNVDLGGVNMSDASIHVQSVLTDPKYTNTNVEVRWGTIDAVVCDTINMLVKGDLDVDGAINKLVEAVEKKIRDDAM